MEISFGYGDYVGVNRSQILSKGVEFRAEPIYILIVQLKEIQADAPPFFGAGISTIEGTPFKYLILRLFSPLRTRMAKDSCNFFK